MKIFTEIIFDIETGRLISEKAYDYSGPIADLKGGKQTSTVSFPPPTAEETRGRAQETALRGFSLQQQGYKFAQQPDGSFSVVPLSDAEMSPQMREQRSREKQIEDIVFRKFLASVGDPLGLTPEESGQIKKVFDASRSQGMENLRQYASELAGARGLNLSDSPVAGELLKQQRGLETQLGGAEAASRLQTGQAQQYFTEGLRQFQEGLRQQAFMNRAGTQAGFGAAANQLTAMRFGQPTQTTRTSGGFDFGGFLGGAGGFAQGGAALGQWLWPKAATSISSFFSDARMKKDIEHLPQLLHKLIQLQPISYSWRDEFSGHGFRTDEKEIGLIAQEVEKIFPELVVENEKGYKSIKYYELPILMLQALKEQQAEITQLKAKMSKLEEPKE